MARLESLLLADDDACRYYLDYVRLHGIMLLAGGAASSGHWVVDRGQPVFVAAAERGGLSQFSSDENGTVPVLPPILLPPIIITDDSSEVPNPQSPIPSASPVLGFLGSAYHGVSGYIGDHDWAKGVLGGTVFLALLFAVLGSIEIFSRWRQANRPQPTTNQVVDVPAVRAARLTGVFDCRWTGSFRPPRNEVLNVDDYINLASGLAEVTYDSGAKVLLQGPCTYKIESPSSGYLKVGRMTARVGSKLSSPGTDRRLVGRGAGGEGGGAGNEELRTKKEELPAPTSSLLLPTSSFVVNTPTATVTDLGTEFGVDVDGVGATDSLVFVGTVKVNTVVGDGQKQGGEVTLIENQSARVERQGGKQYIVRRVAVKSDNFVRPDQIQEWLTTARAAAAKRQEAKNKPIEPKKPADTGEDYAKFVLSLDPVAYYRMERPADPKDEATILDSSTGGNHGVLSRDKESEDPVPAVMPGAFGNALGLRGQLGHDYALVPDYPKATNDQLTVSAWVWVTNRDRWGMIAANWGGQFQFGLYDKNGDLMAQVTQRDGRYIMLREGASKWIPQAEWMHVALVVDGTTLRLYRKGVEVASTACAGLSPNPPLAALGIGCKPNAEGSGPADDHPAYWMGRIDELAIFNKALSPEEIKKLAVEREGMNEEM